MRYGPADADVTYNSQLLPDVTVISDITVEALMNEITPIGVGWESHAGVGVKRAPTITLEAPYADDSNNLRDEVETVGLGNAATLLIALGGSKTFSVSAIVQSITRNISRGNLTVFRAVLQPSGVVTEA